MLGCWLLRTGRLSRQIKAQVETAAWQRSEFTRCVFMFAIYAINSVCCGFAVSVWLTSRFCVKISAVVWSTCASCLTTTKTHISHPCQKFVVIATAKQNNGESYILPVTPPCTKDSSNLSARRRLKHEHNQYQTAAVLGHTQHCSEPAAITSHTQRTRCRKHDFCFWTNVVFSRHCMHSAHWCRLLLRWCSVVCLC